jgi:hypothetical protein
VVVLVVVPFHTWSVRYSIGCADSQYCKRNKCDSDIPTVASTAFGSRDHSHMHRTEELVSRRTTDEKYQN